MILNRWNIHLESTYSNWHKACSIWMRYGFLFTITGNTHKVKPLGFNINIKCICKYKINTFTILAAFSDGTSETTHIHIRIIIFYIHLFCNARFQQLSKELNKQHIFKAWNRKWLSELSPKFRAGDGAHPACSVGRYTLDPRLDAHQCAGVGPPRQVVMGPVCWTEGSSFLSHCGDHRKKGEG